MSTQTQTPTKSIHDLYTFYLSPTHLEEGKKYNPTVAQAVIKPVWNDKQQKNIDEVVLHFTNVRRSLKCNKTQIESMWNITGEDDYTKWAGAKITLEKIPTKRGGKFTIKISKPEEPKA